MAAIKALERWCRLRCDGYRGVSISNMSGSFRDGLAFCALIHSHRPELIDYDSLDKDDVFGNNNLAFRVAEEKLGIPALLDAEDMVALRIPDRLSVLTYVSQYYNYFNGRPAVGGVKRPAEGSKEELSQRRNPPAVAKTFVSKTAAENRAPPARVAETSPKLARVALQAAVVPENAGKTGTLNSKCVACQEHVHLVQRHFVEGKLYHRSCFKCSECSALLHSAAFTVGKEPGTFVCRARHQNKQSGSEPFSSGAASNSGVALQPVRGSNLDGPARRGVSVLEAPSDPVLKRDEPPHVSRSWTVSAQKTQEARRRFFQAAAPGDDGKKTPAPSNVNVPGKQSERPASFGDGAGTATTGKLAEKNCNNNNTAKFTIRSAKRRFGDEPNASDVPGFRQDKTAQGPAAGSRTGHPSTQTNNTESSRRLKAVHGAARPASPRPAAQDPMCQDWRSRLKPVKTGPGLSSPEADTQQRGPQPPSENPPISSFSASRCPAVPTSAAFTAPSPPQPTRRDPQTAPKHQPSAGNQGAKKGKYLSSDASRSETRSAAIQCPQVPADQIVKELNGIEAELGVLEQEGVELEKRLRSFEEEGGGGDILMDPLMVDWFNLIRKKQMYIRKESELVYIARTQDLERQQPGVEGELRRLLEKPDNLKTAAERQRQQMLMERLVEIVNGRNAIVEGLDEDRLREVEEDQQLNKMMQNLAVKKKRKSSISKLFRRRSRRAVE